ncbi:MAG: hypothetical protein VX910_07580 [Candidatus Latescibacterota bacterium]|nr:hypothetical protein [Candidatus Latescibacterota bacterium]
MLDNILTTALQIIIILDICGVVFYFLMSGAANGKGGKSSQNTNPPSPQSPVGFNQAPQLALSSQLQPAVAGVATGTLQSPPIPDWVTNGGRHATDLYGLEGATDVAPRPLGLSARVRSIFSSIKGKFSRRNAHGFEESADLNSDHTRLNKVLDSFREEM